MAFAESLNKQTDANSDLQNAMGKILIRLNAIVNHSDEAALKNMEPKNWIC